MPAPHEEAPRRSVEEHARRVAALLGPTIEAFRSQRVPLQAALGRVTAGRVVAADPSPPFRNSQMDGFAARAGDLVGLPRALPVDVVVAAGPGVPPDLAPGRLAKVMTGAPLPAGADCVVPVEHTEPGHDGVCVRVGREVGDFVREAGTDVAAGAAVLDAGVLLAPRHLAALAAAGVAEVPVRARLRVAILTTGAEVVAPGAPLRFGEVHDANGVALAGLVTEAGGSVVGAELVPDDQAAFAVALGRATASADLVLTSGGVSKGDFEVVRQVLEPRGADVAEVAMQPGGPQATALVDGVPVVCFPGNPVSTQVSFTVFVRPLLRAAAGLPALPGGRLPLARAITSPAGRRQWLRGRVVDGAVHPVGGPGSHLVVAMAQADVLIDVPANAEALAAGTLLDVLPL